MGVKVAKFGGTSLADAEQFLKVRSIVLSDEERRYVVPSAPGRRQPDDQKITDLLYLCHTLAEHSVSFDEIFAIIEERYLGIVEALEIDLDLKPELESIKAQIASGASADYAASRGEYLSGLILAHLLRFDFVDPVEFIVFTHRGEFDSEATQEKAVQVLSRHSRAVIPGFYGARPDGSIKTFSRGGSDITGAIVARGVSASLYENWTDVSGFLMADPRIVDNPLPIEQITYRELRELSYMGANVLHEDAIFPVRKAGIPINIKNTNAPQDKGTLIVKDVGPPTQMGTITGIAGRKDFTVIAVEKALMNAELGFGRRLLSILEDNGISFEHMPTGIDTISVVISDAQLNGRLDRVLASIRNKLSPDSIEVHPNMALIATVGRGMARTPGVAAKLFAALADAGVNVRMIDQGSSEINIIVGVETEDFEVAVRAIYDAFVRARSSADAGLAG